MLRELLAAGIERVEGIGAVGSVFEKVFFGLGLLLHRLVLAEAFALELMDYHPMEVLVVHGIVRAEGGGIIVVDDRLVRMRSVIGAEDSDERRDFALELDIERFEDVQTVGTRLTAHNPVDVMSFC